ncbi:MAG TPA: rhodanese-like domain-containing protein [Methylophilaceae bacterium]|jgi:rhodanese-related sulfurtransferase|nr:rhodanese-like domain-containing protein [Methylophilaceae bacterium]
MEILTTSQLVAIAKVEIIEKDVNTVAQIIKSELPILVDVREPEEFAQGHLAGAINVPRGVLEFKVDPSNPAGMPTLFDKSAQMVVYCKSGARSALAAQTLRTLGYKSVTSMGGGFEAWKVAGLDVAVG